MRTQRRRHRIFPLLKFFLLSPVHRGQVVHDDVVLPVVKCTVTLNLLLFQVNILNVHSRVIDEVSERDFVQSFSKEVI